MVVSRVLLEESWLLDLISRKDDVISKGIFHSCTSTARDGRSALRQGDGSTTAELDGTARVSTPR